MPSALVLLSPGFEEIEAITIIDLLRRAGISVTTAGLIPGPVTGSHDITVTPDDYYKELSQGDFDMLILPGGQPGTNNMKQNRDILGWISDRNNEGKKIAAICAAPTVLHAAGITDGLKITSYPSEKEVFANAQYLEEPVVKDGAIITSRGVGTAIRFSLELIADLVGNNKARDVAEKILFPFKSNS